MIKSKEEILLQDWLQLYRKYANDDPIEDMLAEETEKFLASQLPNDERSVASKAQSELPNDGNQELTEKEKHFIDTLANDLFHQNSTPDGSQGLREALEEIKNISDSYPQYNPAIARIKYIATEALKK